MQADQHEPASKQAQRRRVSRRGLLSMAFAGLLLAAGCKKSRSSTYLLPRRRRRHPPLHRPHSPRPCQSRHQSLRRSQPHRARARSSCRSRSRLARSRPRRR